MSERRPQHIARVRMMRRVLKERLEAAVRERDLSAMQPLIARLSRLGVEHAHIERIVYDAALGARRSGEQEVRP